MPRSLPPGVARQIEGHGIFRDMGAAREGGGRFLLTRHEGGAVAMQLLRYSERDQGFTDRRDVPIGAEAFEALADALFEPVGGPVVRAVPVSLNAINAAVINDQVHPTLCVRVTERVEASGHVALEVGAFGSGTTRAARFYEPAVATYVAAKVDMLREVAWTEGDTRGERCPECSGGEAATGCRLCFGTGTVTAEVADGYRPKTGGKA